MLETRTTSMRHVGMNREAMREIVEGQLQIEQQYILQSERETAKDERCKGFVRCKLMSFGKRIAVFKHQDDTMESFTYQDICRMLMAGEIK